MITELYNPRVLHMSYYIGIVRQENKIQEELQIIEIRNGQVGLAL